MKHRNLREIKYKMSVPRVLGRLIEPGLQIYWLRPIKYWIMSALLQPNSPSQRWYPIKSIFRRFMNTVERIFRHSLTLIRHRIEILRKIPTVKRKMLKVRRKKKIQIRKKKIKISMQALKIIQLELKSHQDQKELVGRSNLGVRARAKKHKVHLFCHYQLIKFTPALLIPLDQEVGPAGMNKSINYENQRYKRMLL